MAKLTEKDIRHGLKQVKRLEKEFKILDKQIDRALGVRYI